MLEALASPLSEPLLRFRCGGCGHELETPAAFAGVEGPCPMCGTVVRAPMAAAAVAPAYPPGTSHPGGLHLPPLPGETGWVELPMNFWDGTEAEPVSMPAEWDAPAEPAVPLPVPVPVQPLQQRAPDPLPDPASLRAGALPRAVLPPPRRASRMPTRDEEEAAAVSNEQQQDFRLRFFDAALLLWFVGTVAMGGAALAFTQPKRGAPPPGAPELSSLVVQRMQEVDQRRDQAVQEARTALQHWVTADNPAEMENWCLPGAPLPALPALAGVAKAPVDFEFIQARRIPGSDRFLTMFELLSDPPLIVPVEGTPAGARLHSQAIVQQQSGTLARFFASQGQAEATFYVLLRPAPGPMAESLVKSRPDLRDFVHVGVEPAFPADGTSGCLACVVPESPAAAILAKRAQDPGLRPAVVRLAWRQHRESGNFVELVAFEPNNWSRH